MQIWTDMHTTVDNMRNIIQYIAVRTGIRHNLSMYRVMNWDPDTAHEPCGIVDHTIVMTRLGAWRARALRQK